MRSSLFLLSLTLLIAGCRYESPSSQKTTMPGDELTLEGSAAELGRIPAGPQIGMSTAKAVMPKRRTLNARPASIARGTEFSPTTTAVSSRGTDVYGVVTTSRLSQNQTYKKPSKFSGSVDLSVDSNLRGADDPGREATTSLVLRPSYQLTSQLSLRAELGVEQKMYANQETSMINTVFTLAHNPIELDLDRALNLSTFAVAPTNEADRQDQTLRAAAGAAVGLNQKFGLFRQTASLGYTLSALKNFHEYERSNLASANLSHRVRHIVSYTQPFHRKLSLEIIARYQTGWTYQNAPRNTFLMSQKLNYAIHRQVDLYFGHSNDGDALQANGIDSNVKVYDETQSHFTTGLVATY